VGWEANGGFLTATNITRDFRTLRALPTRDAALPIAAALYSAKERKLSLVERLSELPRRFSKAGLINNFSSNASQAVLQRFTPTDPGVQCVDFAGGGVQVSYAGGTSTAPAPALLNSLNLIRQDLSQLFGPHDGFDDVVRVNILDGIRTYFRNG